MFNKSIKKNGTDNLSKFQNYVVTKDQTANLKGGEDVIIIEEIGNI